MLNVIEWTLLEYDCEKSEGTPHYGKTLSKLINNISKQSTGTSKGKQGWSSYYCILRDVYIHSLQYSDLSTKFEDFKVWDFKTKVNFSPSTLHEGTIILRVTRTPFICDKFGTEWMKHQFDCWRAINKTKASIQSLPLSLWIEGMSLHCCFRMFRINNNTADVTRVDRLE